MSVTTTRLVGLGRSPVSSSNGGGSSVGFGASGDAFFAGYSNCTTSGKLSVEKITPEGPAWTWTDPTPTSGCLSTSITATPDGGAVETTDAGTPGQVTFRSISPTGSLRWSEEPTGPLGPGLWADHPVVDSNGVIGLPYQEEIPCGDGVHTTCAGFHIDFVSQATGQPALNPFDWEDTTTFPVYGSFGEDFLAVDSGRIYIVRAETGSPALYAYPETGLATSYALCVQEVLIGGENSPPLLSVTPPDGYPGTMFAVQLHCPSGGAPEIEADDSSGHSIFPTTIPTSANGINYSSTFQGDGVPGNYNVAGSCGGTTATPRPFTLLAAQYVAIGDSFASGEGAGDGQFYADSDGSGDYCHRALNGYAEKLAGKLGYTIDFAACSGAVIADMFERSAQYPNEIAQMKHLSAQTKLVTFSMGGNDIGFPDVLTDCVQLTVPGFSPGKYGCANRDATAVNVALQWLQNGRKQGCYLLPGLNEDPPGSGQYEQEKVCGALPSLTELYEDIAVAAPNAKIVVTGYPAFWGDKFQLDFGSRQLTCAVNGIASVSATDALWMNRVAGQINGIIMKAVTAAARATRRTIEFVPISASFETHRECDVSTPFLNPLVLNVVSRPPLGHVNPNSFHPNLAGQNDYFNQVSKKA